MTWTPYAVAAAAALAILATYVEVTLLLDRRRGRRRSTPASPCSPYSWGADLDLFASLTLDEIRALPETREPAP